MMSRQIPAQALSAASRVSSASATSKLAAAPSVRSLATVQDAPPVQRKRGLEDQDRIFQNLYGHHGTDLKSAMKYGDWHRTKDILAKGHDWVWNRSRNKITLIRHESDTMSRLSRKLRLPAFVVAVALVFLPA